MAPAVSRLEWYLAAGGVAAQHPDLAALLRAVAARGEWRSGEWVRFRSHCLFGRVGDPMPSWTGLPPGGRDLTRPILAGLRLHLARVHHPEIARLGARAVMALQAALAAAPGRPAFADIPASRALAVLAAGMVRHGAAPWSRLAPERPTAFFTRPAGRAARAAA